MMHRDELLDHVFQVLRTTRHQRGDQGIGSEARFRLAAFRVVIHRRRRAHRMLGAFLNQLGSGKQERIQKIRYEAFARFPFVDLNEYMSSYSEKRCENR